MSKSEKELLKELSGKKYREQAIWFMNAFWEKDLSLGASDEEKERIWQWTHVCIELDQKGEDGSELDEFLAHRLLEKVDKVLTVKKMREVFKQIDLDFNKRVSLTEFLIYKYGIDYKYLVTAPQASGDALKQLQAAELKLQASQQAMEESKAKEEEAKKLVALQKEAELEVKNALLEIKKEEDKIEAERKEIEGRANDETLGIVKKNKAVAELAQWKAKDHEAGVRRAKIDQEAAVRKQERATKAATAAKIEAEKAREASETKFKEAQDYLEELKARAGAGQGTVWWMMRELDESKKYMSNAQRAKVEQSQASKEAKLKKELGLEV